MLQKNVTASVNPLDGLIKFINFCDVSQDYDLSIDVSPRHAGQGYISNHGDNRRNVISRISDVISDFRDDVRSFLQRALEELRIVIFLDVTFECHQQVTEASIQKPFANVHSGVNICLRWGPQNHMNFAV